MIAGGEAADVERCAALFDALAAHVFHVGPAGSGAAVKLANNLMWFVNNAGVCEALELLAPFGVSEETLAAVGAASTGASWALANRALQEQLIAAHAAAHDGPLEDLSFLVKDLMLALQAARERGVTLPLAEVAERELPAW